MKWAEEWVKNFPLPLRAIGTLLIWFLVAISLGIVFAMTIVSWLIDHIRVVLTVMALVAGFVVFWLFPDLGRLIIRYHVPIQLFLAGWALTIGVLLWRRGTASRLAWADIWLGWTVVIVTALSLPFPTEVWPFLVAPFVGVFLTFATIFVVDVRP